VVKNIFWHFVGSAFCILSYPSKTLADSSTHGGTTGTVFETNGVVWTNGVGGAPNTAIHFDGVNTSIETANSGLFDFTTNLFTINFWVYNLSGQNERYLLQNEDTSGTNAGWDIDVGGSEQIAFAAETNYISTGSGAAPSQGWAMVTVVRAAATNVLLYINGKQAANGNTSSPAPSSNSLKFGVDATKSVF